MKQRKISHCHVHIRKVAKEACAMHYEMLMSSSNVVYQMWKKQHPDLTSKQLMQEFVNRHWSKCIDLARATLGSLLTQPIDEKLKLEIVDILALDSTLIRGRKEPSVVMGELKQSH